MCYIYLSLHLRRMAPLFINCCLNLETELKNKKTKAEIKRKSESINSVTNDPMKNRTIYEIFVRSKFYIDDYICKVSDMYRSILLDLSLRSLFSYF